MRLNRLRASARQPNIVRQSKSHRPGKQQQHRREERGEHRQEGPGQGEARTGSDVGEE